MFKEDAIFLIKHTIISYTANLIINADTGLHENH